MSYTLSVDSASICRFSGVKICPCFLQINELPPILRVKNLILAGLWFGKTKEKIDLFLPPIVKHISDLSKGFHIEVANEKWLVVSFLICCCADSVARCETQGIHSHRGEYPCSWCLIEGEEFELVGFSKPFQPSRAEQFLINRCGQQAKDFSQYRGLVKSGCFYESLALQNKKKRTDNTYAKLKDHTIILIRRIIYNCHSEDIVIVASKVRSSPSVYCPREITQSYPQLCFQYIVNSIDVDVELFSVAQLDMICCSFILPDGHFVSPMPNVFNLY